MWAWLLEWCARNLGATRRPGGGAFYMVTLLLSAVAVFLHIRYGLLAGALLPCVAFVVVGVLAAKATTDARAALWRAVCLGITDPRQRPLQTMDPLLMAPSAITLFKLAATLDAVRRGDTARAAEEVTAVNRSLLRAEEARLLDAARFHNNCCT